MNQTNPKLIFAVVLVIALLATIGVTSICLSLFLHSYADPAILTALITITSGLVGSLTALLVNTRSSSPQEGTTSSTTTTATMLPSVASPAVPAKVEVINPPKNPVNVVAKEPGIPN